MCTYQTERLDVAASGKGPDAWRRFSLATVYFDHPVHQPSDHTVNIDLLDPAAGPGMRLAIELTPASARALATAILDTLASAPFDPQP